MRQKILEVDIPHKVRVLVSQKTESRLPRLLPALLRLDGPFLHAAPADQRALQSNRSTLQVLPSKKKTNSLRKWPMFWASGSREDTPVSSSFEQSAMKKFSRLCSQNDTLSAAHSWPSPNGLPQGVVDRTTAPHPKSRPSALSLHPQQLLCHSQGGGASLSSHQGIAQRDNALVR